MIDVIDRRFTYFIPCTAPVAGDRFRIFTTPFTAPFQLNSTDPDLRNTTVGIPANISAPVF